MALKDALHRIQINLKAGRFANEAAVSQGILLPTLQELGWQIFDTSFVIPEFSIEGKRVDYALCHPQNRPIVLVEVKMVGNTGGADRQLFEYAFHQGVPLVVLTDGQEWSFYLPGERGSYQERRVYKLDLLERETEIAIERLNRYLSYNRVVTGAALESARRDYRDVARLREAQNLLPKAWRQLLEDQDEIILELLADKVEDLCGYKPDLDTCSQFLSSIAGGQPTALLPSVAKQPVRRQRHTVKTRSTRNKKDTSNGSKIGFSLNGIFYPASKATEVMFELFKELNKRDPTFLERYASRKHGHKRRYLDRDKYNLYPGRPDLCEERSVEIISGWWMGNNYSRESISSIIKLAAEVAELKIGKNFSYNLGG